MKKHDDTASAPKHHWLFKLATFCGLAPLIYGSLVFLAWVLTGKITLAAMGVLVTVFGTVLVIIGTILLMIYSRLARVSITELRLPLTAMYINFPVAGFYIAIGYYFYIGSK